MFQQVDAQVGNMPIAIHCLVPQGLVSFSRLANFKMIVDGEIDGVAGVYSSEGFTLVENGERHEFFWSTLYDYKQIPVLLKWLQQQQLGIVQKPKEAVFDFEFV